MIRCWELKDIHMAKDEVWKITCQHGSRGLTLSYRMNWFICICGCMDFTVGVVWHVQISESKSMHMSFESRVKCLYVDAMDF